MIKEGQIKVYSTDKNNSSILWEAEYRKEIDDLINDVKKYIKKNSELESQVKNYKEMTDYVASHKNLKAIKSQLLTGINNLKPMTRMYMCTNGVLHNDDILIDADELKEEIRTLISEKI